MQERINRYKYCRRQRRKKRKRRGERIVILNLIKQFTFWLNELESEGFQCIGTGKKRKWGVLERERSIKS